MSSRIKNTKNRNLNYDARGDHCVRQGRQDWTKVPDCCNCASLE
jgi:hypothetical protein